MLNVLVVISKQNYVVRHHLPFRVIWIYLGRLEHIPVISLAEMEKLESNLKMVRKFRKLICTIDRS